ncbi:MAG: hypothetical protein ACI90V_005049, partial [Bacillariaceae sp.]
RLGGIRENKFLHMFLLSVRRVYVLVLSFLLIFKIQN